MTAMANSGIELSVEEKADFDPMLTHGGEIAADTPVAVQNCRGLVLVFLSCLARPRNEGSTGILHHRERQ